MDIYKKLPLDICLNVIDNFRMDYFNQLKFEIKNGRRKFVFQKILKHKPDLNNYDKYLENNTLLHYWLNIYNIDYDGTPSKFFIHFLGKIFPELDPNSNNLNTVFFYYKKKFIGNYKHFIDLIMQNLEIEEIEDLCNWIVNINYGNGLVNYASIGKSNNSI